MELVTTRTLWNCLLTPPKSVLVLVSSLYKDNRKFFQKEHDATRSFPFTTVVEYVDHHTHAPILHRMVLTCFV